MPPGRTDGLTIQVQYREPLVDRKTHQKRAEIVADGSHSCMVPIDKERLHSLNGRQHKDVAGPQITVQQRFSSAEFRHHLRAHRLLTLELTKPRQQTLA